MNMVNVVVGVFHVARDEEAYLYHLNLPLEEIQTRFGEYLRRMNQLHDRPQWYNALTSNCTTNIRTQHVVAKPAPWDWRLLVDGKGDELLYERSVLDRTLPFAELKHRAHINDRGKAADDAPDFSGRIRSQLDGKAENKANYSLITERVR